MKTIPLWTDEFPKPDDIPVSRLVEKADVAVIGSGYTGLNAALVLANSGGKVAVLEQESIGWGASSRNGSMLTTGLKSPITQIIRRYGIDVARHLWKWSLDAIDHVEKIIIRENIACDFSRPGHAYLAYKPHHYDKIKAYGELLARMFGYEGFEYIDPKDMHQEIGSDAFYGAMTEAYSGLLQPAKYVYGLARAASQAGVLLVDKCRVTGISRRENGFALQTSLGEMEAKEVLVATGGYTTNLVPSIRQGIFPVGSYIIVTEPLSADLQAELSPKRRAFFDSKRFLNYFCLTPDGRMLFGGRANLSTGLDATRSANILKKQMYRVFPQLQGTPITHSWTGKLGVSFDQMPHIGRVNGIHYAYGYSGHGVSIASYLGYEVGRLIAGEISGSVYMDIHHPRFILASLDKLYLPLVSAYFRLEDFLS